MSHHPPVLACLSACLALQQYPSASSLILLSEMVGVLSLSTRGGHRGTLFPRRDALRPSRNSRARATWCKCPRPPSPWCVVGLSSGPNRGREPASL
ncbi:hypothetical protein LY76DRAFT_597939 [Colletotrichum caudatum]|nr:hypothetical protein LY76DRAFT_597939 [Colletotrichum caudatum]